MDFLKNRNSAQPPSLSGTAKYSELWNIAQQYIVTLTVQDETVGGGFEVSTSLDESFSISIGSQWESPFANVMQDAIQKAGGKVAIAGAMAKFAGIETKNKQTSAQLWQSSTPIEFSIPFTFVATNDPEKEVKDKVKNLLKLCAPSENGLMLKAPGPSVADAARGALGLKGRKIKLRIGTFLTLEPCIITRVDAQFENLMGAHGIPLKAKVTVDITSYYSCFTTTDIDTMFGAEQGLNVGATFT